MHTWLLSLNSSLIRLISGIGVLAIYAQNLSPKEYSIIAIALLIGQITTIILDAGINSEILTTKLSDHKSTLTNRLIEGATIKLILCTPVLITYLFLANIHNRQEQIIFFATAMSVPITATIENYTTALKSQARYKLELIISIAQAILIISFSLLLTRHAELAAIAIIAPRLILLIWVSSIIFSLQINTILDTLKPASITRYFIRGRHFSLDSIATNILNQIDGIAITYFLGRDIYGAYQPASRIVMAGISLGSAVAGISVPRARNTEENKNAKKYLIKTFAFFGSAFSIGLTIFLLFIITPLFGSNFKPNNSAITLLSIILMLKFLCAGFGAYLSIFGKQKIRAKINITSIGLCLILFTQLNKNVTQILLSIAISQIFVLISYYIISRKNVEKNITENL